MPNSFLELYRQSTDDPRSDDEIVLEIGQKRPQYLSEFPELAASYQRLTQKPEMPPYEPSGMDYVRQAAGSFVRGAGGIVASIPESLAIAASGISTAVGGDVGVGSGDPTKAQDRASFQVGQAIRRGADALAPAPVEGLEDSFFASKVPAGIGSAAAFMVGGATGKLLKVPQWLGVAGLGSAATGTEFYNDAKAKGADDRTAYLASLTGSIVGLSEALPLARMLNRLDGVTGGSFTKTLVTAGKESFEEALQEASQQFAQNYVAQKLYDKDRELLQDLKEGAGVGGVTGLLFSLITQGIGKHIGRSSGASTPAASPPPIGAGQPSAQAVPAPIPTVPTIPIPEGMKGYTTKNDGSELRDDERVQLEAMARQVKSGTPLTIEQQTAVEATPAYANALTVIQQQMEAEPEAVNTERPTLNAELPATPAAEAPAAAPTTSASSITWEADDLINQADNGGVPAFITANLRRIARENGIEIDGSSTPNEIINDLRAKKAKPAATAASVGEVTNQWDIDNRSDRSGAWFDGGNVNDAARAGFSAALEAGGSTIQAHGMSKEGTLTGGLRNLLGLLRNGLDPARRGGRLDTAPLVSKPGEGLIGATASGSAYVDGPFMLIQRPGTDGLEGKLENLAAVLVNEAHAELTPQIRAAIQAIRPDIVVESYGKAGSVVESLKTTPAAKPATPAAMTQDEYYAAIDKLDSADPEALRITLERQKTANEELAEVNKAIALNGERKRQAISGANSKPDDYFVNRTSELNDYYNVIADLDSESKSLWDRWRVLKSETDQLVGSVDYFRKATPAPEVDKAKVILLRQEGLSEAQARNVLLGKMTPEEAAQEVISAFEQRTADSVDRPVPTMEHMEAVSLAREEAINRINDIVSPAPEIVAAESNESINARVTVEGRSAEMAKRGAAAKALNQSLKEGDIVTRPDGTVMVVNDVMKDGSVTVTIDGKRHFIEGGLAAEFNGGSGEVSTIQRKGEVKDPATPAPANTRGKGTQYHGAREEIESLAEGYYNPDNIYGGEETFYTTDAFDIATGYLRKKPNAAVYKVSEIQPVKLFDMEGRLTPDQWRERLDKVWPEDAVSDAIEAVKGKGDGKPNLREIMDELRADSPHRGISKDELQETFSAIIRDILEKQGYGGMTHIGGLLTKKEPHLVKIYFQPYKQLSITKVTEPVTPEAGAEGGSSNPATAASDKRADRGTQDAKYLAAVEKGDTETARRMVAAAAKKAGYTAEGWHGSPNFGFTDFQVGEQGIHAGTREQAEQAAYFKLVQQEGTSQQGRTFSEMPKDVQEKIRKMEKAGPLLVFLRFANPLRLKEDIFLGSPGQFRIRLKEIWAEKLKKLTPDERTEKLNVGFESLSRKYGNDDKYIRKLELRFERIQAGEINGYVDGVEGELLAESFGSDGKLLAAKTSEEMFAALVDLGFDAIEYPNQKEGDGVSHAVFSPEQIKFAAPVTRDASGKVIPLSQRFKAVQPAATAPSVPVEPPSTSPAAKPEYAPPILNADGVESLLTDLDEKLAVEREVAGVTKESSFFEVEPQGFSLELGERLTKNARVQGQSGSTYSVAFFEDKQTGQVVGLGAIKAKNSTQGPSEWYKVGRAPGQKSGTSLKRLLATGRFQPLGAMTLKTPVKYATTAFSFQSRQEFDQFKVRAVDQLDSVRGTASQVESTKTAVESKGEGVEIVQVDESTPDAILAATEGFTPDESGAIWDALDGIKLKMDGGVLSADSRKKLLGAIARDEDAVHALTQAIKVLSEVKGTDGVGGDANLILRIIEEYIYDAQRTHPKSKENFAKSLAEEINRTGSEAAANSGGSIPGADAGAASGGAEAAAATGGRGAEVRFHSGAVDARYRPAPHQVAAAFRSAVLALANAGYDVNLLQQEAVQATQEFGQIDNAERVVSLVMAEIGDPSTDNLYHLNAEVAHAVFAQLPAEQQQRLQDAIRNATDAMLGITTEFQISPAVPTSQREGVQQEERIVDVVARSLTAQGFDAAKSNTLAQRFWRLLRAVILRAGMAFSRAWGVPSPRLAAQYLQVRVEQFLAGQVRPYSFTDFMGGPRVRVQAQNRQHTFGHGYTSVNYRFNTATGQIEVQEALPSSAAAIISNATNATVRYHGPRNRDGIVIGSPDIGPEIHRYDIAANNEVDAGLQAQYAHWTAMGGNLTATGQPAMSYEQFSAWVTKGAIQVPKESLAQAEATISKMGQAPQDMTLRMAGMNPDGRRTVAAKAYGLYSKLRGHWQEMYRSAADELDPNQAGSKQRKFNREALRTQNILTNYTDALYLWGEIKTDVLGWAKWLKINSKRIGKLNHQKGVLEQVIEEAEGTLDEAIADQYESAINKLVNRFANNDSTKVDFVEMLQTLAATGQLWDQMSTGEILFALKNPGNVTTGVFDIATAIPAIRLLTESSIEARALRSVTAAFLKKNRLMTEMLALRASKAFADRAEVNEALKEAMTGTSRSFDALKRGFNKANKLKGRLERILVNLEEKQRDQRKLMDELKQHREWMFFYENASKPLTQQMATLENVLGIVREDFEPVTGEQYLVVSHPNEDPELILQQNYKTKKLYSTERTVAQDKVMDAEVALMNRWLEAHPAGNPLHGGTMYNRLEMQVQKMRENSMGAQVDKGTRSLIQAVVGSVTVKLDATGIPALKQVARQFRKWVTYHELYKQNAQRWGNDWSNAVSQARKILGYNREQLEFFLERFYDPSWNYLERRTDLQAGAATNADAESAALAALKAYHNLPAKEWAALEKLLKASVGVADQYVKAQEEMGLKVEDKRLGVLRKVRGPRWFEMPRKLSSNLDRVYDVMQSKVNAPGPWAKNPLSELEDIDGSGNSFQDLLATDPAALKAIIDPLFAGDIWDLFVAPLVNRSGRSAFLAPADTTGFQRLASTGEVQAAFLAAPKGDVMAFITNLFNAAGGTVDQAAFTEETLKTFNNWFQQIHNLKKEQSNAAGVVMASIDEIMMNSRQLDEFPAEWVRYARFDMHSIRSTMNTMALHGAFGRNLEAAQRLWAEGDKVLEGRENELKNKVLKPLFELPVKGRSKSYLRKATLDLAKAEGLDLEVLERASKDRAMAKNEMQNFQAFVQSQGGVAMEFKWWSQLLSAMVAWTVQGPKTALIDTTSLFKPIQEIGLSTPALRWTMQNIKGTVMQNVGGFMEIFGKTIKWEADRMRMLHEHGATPAADEYSISERIVSLAMANAAGPNAGLFQRATSAVSIAAGTARELLNASIPKAAANPQFVAIKPALFTQMSQTMHLGSILGTWRTYDDLVARAAQWLNNPARVIERRDPSFRFDKSFAEHLGYGPKFFGLLDDAGAFESLLAKLGEQGLTLEGLAKDFINRGLTGNVMTNQAYERLMTIAPTQLMQEASIVSRPSWMITNPIAHVALPLVGWSIAQTAGLARLFRKDGSGEYAGIKRGLLKFVPVMGVGLAYAMLADWYDEEVLKKKSNRLTFTGDNAAAALVDKTALTGLLGLAGDFANSVINVSTAREFTIDSRVFAISSFQGIWRALATWYHQGDATYATVYRPLIQSMGGSGALQYLQVVNGLLGADNPESRATARINVGNWMRVVGRDAGMEVKTTRGSGDYVPARTTPWVRQMALAAIANDPDEFRSAHREAVAAAREDKRENPESYVKQAYQAQHPLRSTFKVIPTVTEYQKLLMQMPENGRRDVSEAVRLLNIYGERIGIDPYFGREPKQENFVRDLLRDMKKGRDEILKRDAFKLAF